jgi:hypothetical protein
MIRVFPRRNKWTPTDAIVFVGDPPLWFSPIAPVRISVTFTWDVPEGQRLFRAYSRYTDDIKIGGPAFNDPGDEFVPGRFIKGDVTFTSRGCPYSCPWCFVPGREGDIRELPIVPGNIVQDNNLLACSKSHVKAVFEMLRTQTGVVFAGGLDAKLLQRWHVDQFLDLSIKEMWFSCDTIDDLTIIERVADLLHNFPTNKKRCYCLLGFEGESPEMAEERLERVYELGFLPFAQLYRPIDSDKKQHHSRVWRDLARKWSRPAIYRSKPPETTEGGWEDD